MNLTFEICIKEFRIKLGFTQKYLSARTGLSQGYIAKLESSNRTKSPTLRTIYVIGKIFNICPFRLIVCSGDCNNCKLKYW